MSVKNRSAPNTPDFDEDGVQRFSHQDEFGREIPDGVPCEMFVPFQEETLGEKIQRELFMVAMRQQAIAEGFDTPEEADDLDIPDDPLDPLTPWEAEYEASQQRRVVSRRASEGSVSPRSTEKMAEKPISASGVGTPDKRSPDSGVDVREIGTPSAVSRNEDKSK